MKIEDEDREFYNLNGSDLLELQKPLYGICDSGGYWGASFEKDIRDELGMTSLDSDPSLHTLDGVDGATGLLGAYVDDDLFACWQAFKDAVKSTAARFESKPIEKDNVEFVCLTFCTEKLSVTAEDTFWEANRTIARTHRR